LPQNTGQINICPAKSVPVWSINFNVTLPEASGPVSKPTDPLNYFQALETTKNAPLCGQIKSLF